MLFWASTGVEVSVILPVTVVVCLCQSVNIDVWQTLADLFNKLADINISSVETCSERPAEGDVIVFLHWFY